MKKLRRKRMLMQGVSAACNMGGTWMMVVTVCQIVKSSERGTAGGFAVGMLAALAYFGWRMNTAYNNVMDACSRVNTLADTVQTSLDTLDQSQLDDMMQDLPEITEQLKSIDVDALNKVLTELPSLMDTVSQLQAQVESITNWFNGLGSVFGR